jgi:hypothetical protein
VQTATLAIIAVVSALGLLGIVVMEPIFVAQHQAQARGCENGLPNAAVGFNASQGRCFGH